MNIQLIHTEADHAAALRRIDGLMDALPGTSEADELDALATRVEDYENRRFPIDDPGTLAAIAFRMDQIGIPFEARFGRD